MLGLAAAARLPAQTVSVGWLPAEPRQGSFVVITVAPGPGDAIAGLHGTLAGEPLHFEQDADSTWRAVGGIPVTAAETIPITLEVTGRRGAPEHRFVRMPVTRVAFAAERLRVAPQFTAPPDSALAARIRAETEAAQQVARRSHETPRLWHGAFQRPAGGPISSTFGTGREFNNEVRSRHMGVDFSGEGGAPVRAPNRGIVALVGDFYYAGNVVYVDHGRGLVTAYLHLSEVVVAHGDTLAAGDLIGRIGATGRVTGPHLHWTARYGRVTVDPLGLLELDALLGAALDRAQGRR